MGVPTGPTTMRFISSMELPKISCPLMPTRISPCTIHVNEFLRDSVPQSLHLTILHPRSKYLHFVMESYTFWMRPSCAAARCRQRKTCNTRQQDRQCHNPGFGMFSVIFRSHNNRLTMHVVSSSCAQDCVELEAVIRQSKPYISHLRRR